MELDIGFFSVAIPRDRDRERLRRQADENERYIALLTQDQRARILQGELRENSGSIEEKLVDVLCAVETVRQAKDIADPSVQTSADAVVVFSQDADLAPGLQLAGEFGVPVYAIAPGKVDRRGHGFLVISEPELADLVGANEPFGHTLRRHIAARAVSPSTDSWEYQYQKDLGRRGTVAYMRHRSGLIGVCDSSIVDGCTPGELLDLAPHGVLPARGNDFPELELGLVPHVSETLVRGTVVGRFRLHQITVDIGERDQPSTYTTNNYITPGTEVLLQRLEEGRFRFVGVLDDPPPLVGCGGLEMGAVSLVVTVTERRGRHATAVGQRPNLTVFLPNAADQTVEGSRYLVALVGSGRDPSSPFVAHLASSALQP
jgi:hypothetical protein